MLMRVTRSGSLMPANRHDKRRETMNVQFETG